MIYDIYDKEGKFCGTYSGPFPENSVPEGGRFEDYVERQRVGAKIDIDMNRMQRNALLKASDWTQLPDAPADREKWAVYRQALRDMSFEEPISWPIEPS